MMRASVGDHLGDLGKYSMMYGSPVQRGLQRPPGSQLVCSAGCIFFIQCFTTVSFGLTGSNLSPQ